MRVSKEIINLVPYVPGKPIEETKRELGLETVYKLASNENPLGPSPLAMEFISKALHDLHRYPDPSCYELKKEWAEFYRVHPQWVAFGNGSNELIDLLIRIYCEPGESILTSQAAFVAYSICAQAARVGVIETPLTSDYKFSVEHLLSEIKQAETKKIRLLFIANPNNPTGTYLNKQELETVLAAAHEHENLLTVVDEAYVEFVRAQDYSHALPLQERFPRLCVLRTMSKVFGLAGLRLGALVAEPKIIDYVHRVRNPFNVNSLAQAAARGALKDAVYLKRVVENNAQGLDYFYKELKRLGLQYCPSEANFVFFDTGRDAQKVYNAWLHHGVIARPVKNYGFTRHLRLSVGTKDENERSMRTLEKVLEEIPESSS